MTDTTTTTAADPAATTTTASAQSAAQPAADASAAAAAAQAADPAKAGEAAKAADPAKAAQKDLLFDDTVHDKKDDPAKEGDKKPDEKDGDKKDDEAKEGEKVEYTDFKVPENADIIVDPEQVAWLKEYGQANKLTQDQAQALVDKGVEMQQKNLDFWQDTKKGWREQVEKDPVLGGPNLSTSVKNANDVVRQFAGGDKELQELQDDLVLLGLGNKRSFIRLMNNVHKATADDTAAGKSGGGKQEQTNLAAKMWPGMPA